jgi:hypothetical protein
MKEMNMLCILYIQIYKNLQSVAVLYAAVCKEGIFYRFMAILALNPGFLPSRVHLY